MVKSSESATEICREIVEEVELDIDETALSHLNRFRLARIQGQAIESNHQSTEPLVSTAEDTAIAVEELRTLSSGDWDGELLKSIRERLDLTQEDLGNRVGVSLHTVSSWERHETTPAPPSRDHLVGYLLTVSAAGA